MATPCTLEKAIYIYAFISLSAVRFVYKRVCLRVRVEFLYLLIEEFMQVSYSPVPGRFARESVAVLQYWGSVLVGTHTI